MKKIIKMAVLTAALISLGLLYSCYMSSSFGNGSLALHLAADFSSSSPRTLGDSSNNTARVWLLDAEGSVFPLSDDLEYRQADIGASGTDINIENIPAGQYTVLLSVGNIDSTEFFDVLQYGQSEAVSITSGSTAEMTLPLGPSPFSTYLKGVGLKGVKEFEGTVYAVSADKLYNSTLANLANIGFNPANTPADYEVQSLSIGKVVSTGDSAIWLNTNKGILPYKTGTSFDTSFSSGLGDITIFDSGALDSSESFPITVFFQREGGLGGVYITNEAKDSPSTWNWLNIDLSDVITGQPVLGFYMTDNYAYFATKLGAFRLSSDIITTYNGTDIPDLMNYADFFSINDADGGEIPILAIAGYKTGADTYLVMGTEKGAYTVKLTEGDAVHAYTTAPALLSGTAGYGIRKMAAKSDGSYIAMLSGRDLFIYNSVAETVMHYPFNSGLPGTLTDLAWAGTELLISGTAGLVSITPTP